MSCPHLLLTSSSLHLTYPPPLSHLTSSPPPHFTSTHTLLSSPLHSSTNLSSPLLHLYTYSSPHISTPHLSTPHLSSPLLFSPHLYSTSTHTHLSSSPLHSSPQLRPSGDSLRFHKRPVPSRDLLIYHCGGSQSSARPSSDQHRSTLG